MSISNENTTAVQTTESNGGAGADFVISQSQGDTQINDFNPHHGDKLVFDDSWGIKSKEELVSLIKDIHNENGNIIVNFGDNVTITLVDVQADDISLDNVVIGDEQGGAGQGNQGQGNQGQGNQGQGNQGQGNQGQGDQGNRGHKDDHKHDRDHKDDHHNGGTNPDRDHKHDRDHKDDHKHDRDHKDDHKHDRDHKDDHHNGGTNPDRDHKHDRDHKDDHKHDRDHKDDHHNGGTNPDRDHKHEDHHGGTNPGRDHKHDDHHGGTNPGSGRGGHHDNDGHKHHHVDCRPDTPAQGTEGASDNFAFNDLGHWRVEGFNAAEGDTLDVSGHGLSREQIVSLITDINNEDGNFVVNFGDDVSITLVGVKADDITWDHVDVGV